MGWCGLGLLGLLRGLASGPRARGRPAAVPPPLAAPVVAAPPGRSGASLLDEIFEAYDFDADGILSYDEMSEFNEDTSGQPLSPSIFTELLNLPGERNSTATAGQKPGLSRSQLASIYVGSPEVLVTDHARVMRPRVQTLLSLGLATIATLQLGRALRRALKRGLAPLPAASGEGAMRQVTADVGQGPARIRAGWLLASGDLELTAPGRSLPPLQFIDPSGKASETLKEYAERAMLLAPTGDVVPTRMTFRPSEDGAEREEVGTAAVVEDDSALGIGTVLNAIRSIFLGAKNDAGPSGTGGGATGSADSTPPKVVMPPRVPPPSDESQKKKQSKAKPRSDEAKRAALQQIARLTFPIPEPANEVDDDVGRAYKSVRDFTVLKEGDPAYVKLEAFRGSPDVKAQLTELVELLQKPERYAKVGAKPPKGVLMCGEPGTGKTYAARAVASEAGVPFLAISGSDFRQSPFSGVGTSMTLKMFDEARKRAPCIIFIDEIDSLGEARRQGPTAFLDAGEMGGSVTRDQDANLNALLAKMDGFQPSSGVLFLAATNRPEVLDEALLRSGRFDRRIEFKLPDLPSRQEILGGYAEALNFDGKGPDYKDLAKRTPAFSPADLEGLLNSAAMGAARADREAIAAEDVEASLEDAKKRKAKARPEGSFQVTECVDVSFADVCGHDEAVGELRDLVDALVDREKYRKVGAVPPRGVLLEGPPGVGKTHCAKALAGEVGLPFLSASGSDFQASRYAGQGTQLVKRLFALARKLQPCILFIDEVDALGRRRSANAMGAEQDRENTMMQLLVELDGFEERSETLVLAATNRAEVLDQALLRPGRLDRRVALELPDQKGRQAILELYAKDKPLTEELDLAEVARRTSGFSGADIKNLMNEAALLAAKREAEKVSRDCVFRAADRISLGIEKANPLRSREAQRLTAVHEAGHAVLGMAFSPMTQRRVARASIRPRTGGVGGVTVFEPLEEGAAGVLPGGIVTKQAALASLCVDLGGRVAEEALLQPLEVSSGARGDFQSATRRAMAMVTDWGLVDSVLSVDALGSRCSDATLHQAEQAASRVLSRALASARAVLAADEGRRCLELVAERLLEVEEADAAELSAPPVDVLALQESARTESTSWVEVL